MFIVKLYSLLNEPYLSLNIFLFCYSRAILRNQDVLSSSPLADLWRNDFWGTPLNSSGSHGSYRPLCVLTFRLNHWVCGFRPGAFHLVNVLLHVLNCALVLRVARLLLPTSAAPLAALLFATHPVHTEAVTGIVGRADLLACLFFLLSFISYLYHVNLRDSRVKSRLKTFTCKTKMKCCQELVSEDKCALVEQVKDVFGFLGWSLSPLGVKCVNYSSSTARQWGCLLLCLGFAVAATLSKETGITVLLVCVTYDLLRSSRVWPGVLPLCISLGSLTSALCCTLLLRLYLMGQHTPSFASADNPTAHSPHILTRLFTFLYLPLFNLQLLIWPRWLSFDWSMDAIPRITCFTDSRNVLSVLVYFVIYKAVSRAWTTINELRNHKHSEKESIRNSRAIKVKIRSCSVCKHHSSDHHSASCRANNNNNLVSKCDCVKPLPRILSASSDQPRTNSEVFLISFAFLVFPFLPATNILFYVGFVVAERVLYLPSIGYCFLVALGCHILTKKTNRRLVKAMFVLTLVVFGGKTIRRNKDWKDEESLYRSGILVNPPKAYGNLGSVLNSQGRLEEAERAYNMALKFRPNMADVHYNLGVLLQGRGQFEEAIRSYHNAIQCRPSLALAHLKLGELLASRGRCEEAERVFRRCAQLDVRGLKDPRLHEETKMAALIHLGRLHGDRGRHQDAVSVYKEAVEMIPTHYEPQVLYNLLGESLARLGNLAEAELWFKAAIDSKPDQVSAHLTYGKHLARNKTRILEAEQWFIKAQRLAPADPFVYQQYGQLLTVQERFEEAAHQYIRAVQLSPRNYDLILGAATALREAGRYSQAEVYYRRALSLRPQDSTSHSNLGAMLHLSGKLTEAEASYREALRIDPHDVTTLTNVHKLRHLMARIAT